MREVIFGQLQVTKNIILLTNNNYTMFGLKMTQVNKNKMMFSKII